MIIKTQLHQNNNSMEFFLPKKIAGMNYLKANKRTYSENHPLIKTLFEVEGVNELIMTPDSVFITKSETSNWNMLKPQILAEITDFISLNNIEENTIDTIKQIEGLISARIRPAIQQDGGDIEFKDFHNGIVYVELKGNCVGCAYALVTLKEGVEKLLKTYIPEVKEVRSVDKKDI